MKDETEILIDEKVKQVTALLGDKETKLRIGQILAKALDNIEPEKGMGAYYIEQIDLHNRGIAFEKRLEYFDQLFDFLKENNHTKDNSNISEHDSAWYHEYTDCRRKGAIKKVIAIDNMLGSSSHIFIKEEFLVGEEDWSNYYIVKAWKNPDQFLREDCGRKSLRTLIKHGKLRLFEDFYADGDRRLSFDDYEKSSFDMEKIHYDYERCVLRYDCRDNTYMNYNYFNSAKSCEYALGQLESAYWMRVE